MNKCVLGCAALLSFSMLAGDAPVAENTPRAGTAAPAEVRNPIEIYTLYDLLRKAETIVVADIGAPADDGTVVLNIQDVLKAPENDPKRIDPEKFKRAADLLATEQNKHAAEKPANPSLPAPGKPAEVPVPTAAPAAPAGPKAIRVRLNENAKLPARGTQAIFFLWDKEEQKAASVPVYRLGHPQNVYDLNVLAHVKAGVTRPRGVADGRYLRDWDREMAQRNKQREIDRQLAQAKGGETQLGMRVVAINPQLSIRRDSSFAVRARLENTSKREQAIYDGPAGGYGARLRPKDGGPEAALILRLSMANYVEGLDDSVLGLKDASDFTSVPGDGSVSKELFFDSAKFPALTKLHGEYMVSVIYSNAFDGPSAELGCPTWTGTVVSEELPLTFK